MSLSQLAATILFFYVFGLGAVLLTWYAVRTIRELIQISREQKSKAAKALPADEENSVKLHISGGLIEVNRLPNEENET